MRLSNLPLTTLKEVPADAEIVSHKLMLRAAMIRKVAAGIYNWLPVGFRVMKKVEAIVREEMDAAGALELLMPSVQPAELWHESGRWDGIGAELLKFRDRHDRDFCYGPTHEEVITDIARNVIRSYKQLPVNYYQIQTKFRDEIRPRFGVMRSREFIMKDAYSFDLDSTGMARSYAIMHEAYVRIFTRLGLKFRPVQADSGNIGGSASEEFHVLADSGEDAIAFSDTSNYAANVEMAVAVAPDTPRAAPAEAMESVETPQARTIAEVSAMMGVVPESCLKTLLVKGDDGGVVALVLRGDHELNALKAEKLDGIAAPLALAEADDVAAAGSVPGFIGPMGLSCPVIADHSALVAANFVCGANEADRHLRYVNWVRDMPEPAAADLRNVRDGDPSPDGQGLLSIARGIEVGHIFQLGTKYSDSLGARVLDDNGKEQTLFMGCYGIGVTRIVAAAIEQNHDDNGIVWPDAIAPWHIALIPINMHKSERLANAANELYDTLTGAGYDVLFDDRNARPGVKFADADLLGLPHRVVISDRGLDAGELEYKHRRAADSQKLPADQIMAFLKQHVQIAPA